VDPGTVAALVGLALVDSTSIGTLMLPIAMLVQPGLRVSRFVVYLTTVAVFYLGVGVALVTGVEAVGSSLPGAGAALEDSVALDWAQLALGVVLFALSFRYDATATARRAARGGRPTRGARWRARLLEGRGTLVAVVGLGVGAAGLEVATMLPYLAAVGLISAAGLSTGWWLLTLAGYVAVMVAPAAVLLLARLVARRRVEPLLARVHAWTRRQAAGSLGWVLGLVGVLLAVDALRRLGLLDGLDGLG